MAFENYINLFRAAVVRIKGTKLISGVRNRDDDVISSPWLVRLKLTISSFQRCYSMTDNPEKEKVGLGPKQLKMQAFFMRTIRKISFVRQQFDSPNAVISGATPHLILSPF